MEFRVDQSPRCKRVIAGKRFRIGIAPRNVASDDRDVRKASSPFVFQNRDINRAVWDVPLDIETKDIFMIADCE